MNRRTVAKLGVFLGAAALLTAVGGMAVAHGMDHMRGEFMKKMVAKHIDEALDYAKVDDGQRQKIHDIRDRVITQMEANKPAREEHLAAFKDLFLADTVDMTKVAAFRSEQQERMQKMGDVIQQAFLDAHDTLTTEQRAKIVEYVEQQKGKHCNWGDHGMPE